MKNLVFKILALGIFLVISCSIHYYFFMSKDTNAKVYFENFDLNLKGKITDAHHLTNGVGFIKIEVLSSNKEFYDPRQDYGSYLCVIKGKEGEFILNDFNSIKIGDSLVINDSIRLYRNGNLVMVNRLELATPSAYVFADLFHEL